MEVHNIILLLKNYSNWSEIILIGYVDIVTNNTTAQDFASELSIYNSGNLPIFKILSSRHSANFWQFGGTFSHEEFFSYLASSCLSSPSLLPPSPLLAE